MTRKAALPHDKNNQNNQIDLQRYEVWFVTGSQQLYGPETLDQVAAHALEIASALDEAPSIPARVVYKPVLTDADAVRRLCLEANATPDCVGLICWMHTFSPAKLWIAGLMALQKPFAHLHTQYIRDIPWAEIDMAFMNLNQSAHGDREFGFIGSRLRKERKVVVGHWQDAAVIQSLGVWTRAACAWADWQGAQVVRLGDNMREVAVTEGDKVEAQRRFGYAVNGYGVGEVVQAIAQVTDAEIDRMIAEYEARYQIARELLAGGESHQRLRAGARQELGIRRFLDSHQAKAWTTTFEDLHGLDQLPGLAAQRLMNAGYGYGAEGDWKTAALVRALLVMGAGLPGGASFMEDYTYHLDPAGVRILGAHMLEVSEQIAAEQPRLEAHPLSIGGKADPVRLVFNARSGPAVAASIVDLGARFRMVVNTVDAVPIAQPLPKLPVARALWAPQPDFTTATTAWILAGGAHHTAFSYALTAAHLADFAQMAGIEFVLIDHETKLSEFQRELRWNDVYYLLAKGL
jgi:L-arabinose isomerase